MGLGRHVKFWGWECLKNLGISMLTSLMFLIFNSLGVETYVGGFGYAAVFGAYLGCVGCIVITAAAVNGLQKQFPLLVSMSMTRKTAAVGSLAAQTALIGAHVLIITVLWVIASGGLNEDMGFVISLAVSVMAGFGILGLLFGSAILRWGKVGIILMMAAFIVGGAASGMLFALNDGEFLKKQIVKLEHITELNLLPIAMGILVIYGVAGIFSVVVTRKIEVRV